MSRNTRFMLIAVLLIASVLVFPACGLFANAPQAIASIEGAFPAEEQSESISDSVALLSNVEVNLALQANDFVYATSGGVQYRLREPGVQMVWVDSDGKQFDLQTAVRNFGPLNGTWIRMSNADGSEAVYVYEDPQDIPPAQ